MAAANASLTDNDYYRKLNGAHEDDQTQGENTPADAGVQDVMAWLNFEAFSRDPSAPVYSDFYRVVEQ